MDNLINEYSCEVQCDYKGRTYKVRDNGSILRCAKSEGRVSKYDNLWTFGKKSECNGYMIFANDVRVHQVVCTAFHGTKPREDMVVDHIDTNRCNNRPENLRWVTRLENALNNPYTRKRIINICGSIENFLNNPSLLREESKNPNFKWMRTVSKAEAQNCFKRLNEWLKEDEKLVNGNGLGEWIFSDYLSPAKIMSSQYQHLDTYELEDDILIDSLTSKAKQLNWFTPTQFLLCPNTENEVSLESYYKNLEEGKLFTKTKYGEYVVLKFDYNLDKSALYVLTRFKGDNVVKPWALSKIFVKDGYYVHENRHSFFEEIGGLKRFTIEIGQEWTGSDCVDDYC